ncbi:hypothetical protein ACFL6H_01405, partial [Candidatus Latescibacterota bacterium]
HYDVTFTFSVIKDWQDREDWDTWGDIVGIATATQEVSLESQYMCFRNLDAPSPFELVLSGLSYPELGPELIMRLPDPDPHPGFFSYEYEAYPCTGSEVDMSYGPSALECGGFKDRGFTLTEGTQTRSYDSVLTVTVNYTITLKKESP